MDLIPVETQEPTVYEKYSEELDILLSDEAKLAKGLNRLPSNKERKQRFLSAINEAFELVGGVPRLAIWADRNYGQFIKLVGRTLPSMIQQVQVNTPGPVQIISAIPSTILDGEDIQAEYKEVKNDKA